MNYVEIGILVIIAGFAVKGNIKGIIGELTSIVSILLALLGVAILVKIIGSSLDRDFNDAIVGSIFLVLLVMLSQAFRIIIVSLKVFAKLPIVNGINRFLGLILGLVEGLVAVWIVFIVISKYDLLQKSNEIIGLVLDNPYAAFLYHHNLLAKLF